MQQPDIYQQQQQGYPPQQQQGYPPQSDDYPPQKQQGYPPQKQQQGYPPQQQQGYPPQSDDYPSDDFTFGLFKCFDNGDACMEGCCCTYCQISAQFNSTEHNNTGIYFPVCCGMIFLDFCCGLYPFAQCVGNMIVRDNIRSRYNIQSNCCNDCWVSLLCRCCASTQQYQELVFRGAWPGGVCIDTRPPEQADPMGLESSMIRL